MEANNNLDLRMMGECVLVEAMQEDASDSGACCKSLQKRQVLVESALMRRSVRFCMSSLAQMKDKL